jgi:hypothetical protein
MCGWVEASVGRMDERRIDRHIQRKTEKDKDNISLNDEVFTIQR